MSDTAASAPVQRFDPFRRMPAPLVVVGLLVITLILYGSYVVLTDRYLGTLQNRALVRATLYTGTISKVLQTYGMASALITQDRNLVSVLTGGPNEQTQLVLGALQTEINARNLHLYTSAGQLAATTAPNGLPDINHTAAPYFESALGTDISVFATVAVSNSDQRFLFARRIAQRGTILGVVVLELDLAPLQAEWSSSQNQIFVTNADDLILLSSRAEWRYRLLSTFFEASFRPDTMRGLNLLPILQLGGTEVGQLVEIDGEVFLQIEQDLDFRGWRLTYLAPTIDATARVNAVLALEIMVLALAVASIAYISSRRVAQHSLRVQRESEELRALNVRLSSEIEERMRVQESLQAAEKSLEQSSKLAALGQMSTAISHELNQPLAAMKTYLAGARLLLRRNRGGEALASFQRIDDLITRMSAITRQLKSFAHKGDGEVSQVELGAVITSSLAMMSPQLSEGKVPIERVTPPYPVYVMGDTLRLEQILINLFRNALDAMKDSAAPSITVELFGGETLARIQVRDTGPGLPADPRGLFEPFYTTKEPGEGTGLGLAISSGIAEELGGALTARNSSQGGAIFELSLPRVKEGKTT
ncbi:MAG: ATP-binding protein [Pseudomonadota bacterium]